VLGAAASAVLAGLRPTEPEITWHEEALDRGDIVVKVRATGTLRPARTVSVGTEVSGRVEDVLVDHNDQVTRGQVLLRLDDDTFENSLKEAKASARAAAAEVTRADASLGQAQFNARQASDLAARGTISQSEHVMAQTELEVAKAALVNARAQRSLANVRVEQARDQLDKVVVVSPIDGVVLERSVEPGNTIVASMQSPELFVLAEDLSSMELELDVDEADVGQLAEGQHASFAVDAWLGKEFTATVARVHYSPKTTNTVVTYTARLAVDNTELLLRPGMTASADIVTHTRQGVLRVPNTALRFEPPREDDEDGGFQLAPPMQQPKKRATRSAIWVLDDGVPVQAEASLGASDGYYTEITSGDLAEGSLVLVGFSGESES
jgi:HlyD family secretion protein